MVGSSWLIWQHEVDAVQPGHMFQEPTRLQLNTHVDVNAPGTDNMQSRDKISGAPISFNILAWFDVRAREPKAHPGVMLPKIKGCEGRPASYIKHRTFADSVESTECVAGPESCS